MKAVAILTGVFVALFANPAKAGDWEIAQKISMGGPDQYSGPIYNEMTFSGHRDGLKNSLAQLILSPDGIEFIFTIYNCSGVNRHFSHESIFWNNEDESKNIANIREAMIPVVNFALAQCGLKANASAIFSGSFEPRFHELASRYRAYKKAQTKAESLPHFEPAQVPQ